MFVTVALCTKCVETVTHPRAGQIFRRDPVAPEFYAVADALRVRDVSALLDAMTRGEHLVLTLWVGNGCYPMPMRAVYDEGDSPTCGQRWHPCDAW